jgi:hypothetical protein
LENKLSENHKKELSLWEKYSEEGMPKSIFENLRAKCEDEKSNLENALVRAYKEMPKRIDYAEKIIRFQEAVDLLRNQSASAESKNAFLKTIIDRIEYSRPPAIRYRPEQVEDKDITLVNGWYQQDFKLDIYLLI